MNFSPHRKPTVGHYLCPLCNVLARTDVTDSRPREDGTMRRRRYCNECKGKFSTVEIPMDQYDALLPAVARQSSKARIALNAFITEYNALHRAVHSAAKRK